MPELSVASPTVAGVTSTAATTDPTAGSLPPVVLGSLSPSRAADFKNCPLLYRFRCVDRLPQAPSLAAARGTLVHAVLEALFDQPSRQRTPEVAKTLLPSAWERVLAEEPALGDLFADEAGGDRFQEWMTSAADLLTNYFRLEDPRRLEPAAREQLVEVVLDGLRLRGYVDRLDVNAAGDIRVVDYKTGASPREAFEGKALFQMKFYALVLWRTRGVVPRQLRLMYLADSDTLTYTPDADELTRFENTLRAIWAAIQRAMETGDFRPNPGRLCEWCDHQALCPSFGGTPPPFPQDATLTDPRDDLPVRPNAGVGGTV
jgi:putative RecB family exonuclease